MNFIWTVLGLVVVVGLVGGWLAFGLYGAGQVCEKHPRWTWPLLSGFLLVVLLFAYSLTCAIEVTDAVANGAAFRFGMCQQNAALAKKLGATP